MKALHEARPVRPLDTSSYRVELRGSAFAFEASVELNGEMRWVPAQHYTVLEEIAQHLAREIWGETASSRHWLNCIRVGDWNVIVTKPDRVGFVFHVLEVADRYGKPAVRLLRNVSESLRLVEALAGMRLSQMEREDEERERIAAWRPH